MKAMKAVTALVRDEPLNAEERIEKLELDTERKLRQFEEALGVFKDLVLKFHEENEELKAENSSLRGSVSQAASDVKEAIVRPLANAGEDFVQLLADKEGSAKPALRAEHIQSGFETDEMERTISWMREKFGLSPSIEAAKPKSKGKKKKK